MKVEESLNVTFDETPPPPKTSPLEDDELVEEEAIKVSKTKPIGNDLEDISLENNQIINIKESKTHPLENVIGNLNQRTLRSQAQDKSNFFCFISTLEPKNINEALKDENWVMDMQEELNQFKTNEVWELVPNPMDMTIIGTKLVYRNKLDENSVVTRNKARLVAQGYNQQEGIDYDETYAPIARLDSIRILLAYACALDFKLYQMDVKSAEGPDKLNGSLQPIKDDSQDVLALERIEEYEVLHFNDEFSSLGREFMDSLNILFQDLIQPHYSDEDICNDFLVEDELRLCLEDEERMLLCKFPWSDDYTVGRNFWLALACLDPSRKGWLSEEHIDLWVNYMWHGRPDNANWAMVSCYFVQILLQNSTPLFYANGDKYAAPWSDVDRVIVYYSGIY
ncbi:retrovirus-related pol polyprotein from transposon TNT 1-94 [Tanacetum coccineum]